MAPLPRHIVDLASLPADIIRTIIRLEKVEDLDEMCMISHQWNSLVRELIVNRRRFVSIPSLVFSFENNNSDDLEGISLLRNPNSTIEQYSPVNTKIGDNPILNGRIVRVIRRSSKIVDLEFDLFKHTLQRIKLVGRYLADIPVTRLVCSNIRPLCTESRDILLDFMKHHAVQHFQTTLAYLDSAGICDIIMEAMQFLQTFEVFQNGYCPSSSFWEKIVQELNNSGIVQALFNYNSKSFGVFTKKIMIIRVQRIASSHLERPISV